MSTAAPTASQELGPRLFGRVAEIARREAGLHIPEAKRAMVQSRLNRRLRALGLDGFDAYLDLVEGRNGSGELREMISVLTTNVSHFFREPHHFDTLGGEVLPPLLRRAAEGGRVRIWSAGCSSGQEPYSIAMVLHRLDPDVASRDVRILATDIDPRILDQARRGTYEARALSGLSDADRSRYLEPASDGPDRFSIHPDLRALVTFRELNLLSPWPMRGLFDAIFCRNVVIYFDDDTQMRLWPRFEAALHPGGWLFLGHSERVQRASGTALDPCGITTYRRPGKGRTDAIAVAEGEAPCR